MLNNEGKSNVSAGKVEPANLDMNDPKTLQIAGEIFRFERRLKAQRDTDARNDPLLRLCMVELIHHLSELVQDYAGLLAMKRGDGSWFNADRAADEIMWQLYEFVSQSHAERNDDPSDVYQALIKPHQLTKDHAADWFDVPMVIVEGHKGFVPGFHADEFNSEEKPLIWSA